VDASNVPCTSVTTYCTKTLPPVNPEIPTVTYSECPKRPTKTLPTVCVGTTTSEVVTTEDASKNPCTSTTEYCVPTSTYPSCPTSTPKVCSQGIRITKVVTATNEYNKPCTKVATYCNGENKDQPTPVMTTDENEPTPEITTPPSLTLTPTATATATATILRKCPKVAAKSLPLTCDNGLKVSKVVTTVDASNDPCTSITEYCTKIPYTGTSILPSCMPTKALPIDTCGPYVRSTEVITTVNSDNYTCTSIKSYCGKTLPTGITITNPTSTIMENSQTPVTTTTTPTVTNLPMCPGAAKTIPVTCDDGVKTTKVVTTMNASNVPCTSVTAYCTNTLPRCMPSKTLPIDTCKNYPRSYEIVTKVERNSVTCTSTVTYCGKILPTKLPDSKMIPTGLPKCSGSTKTIPLYCINGVEATETIVTTDPYNNVPCTSIRSYCTKVLPNSVSALAECPKSDTKTIPLDCKGGIKTSSVLTKFNASDVPCTSVIDYCTTTKRLPISVTSQDTDCVPEIITVTEKDIETITDKVTITKTIYEDAGETDTPSQNCAGKYEQCGGKNFKGPTCCRTGSCHVISEYYSQCY